jgi:hypothetical protein
MAEGVHVSPPERTVINVTVVAVVRAAVVTMHTVILPSVSRSRDEASVVSSRTEDRAKEYGG